MNDEFDFSSCFTKILGCHELQWFEKGGSVVFVAEPGKKFIWFLSTEMSIKGKYKTVQKSFVIRTQWSG